VGAPQNLNQVQQYSVVRILPIWRGEHELAKTAHLLDVATDNLNKEVSRNSHHAVFERRALSLHVEIECLGIDADGM
jgi:hypothetical protein